MTDVDTEVEGGRADTDLSLDLYRRMTLIRGFEDRVQSLFLQGHVYGTTHLCSGQEATEVGVAGVLRHGDRVAGTYRGHGHALALGLQPQKLMDELLGRATGICGGRAGSMNVVDLEHGLMGCFGIVGGSISAATGAGLAFRRSDRVAVAFFGEGAVNQAYFYECLNFAQVYGLPAVYVCENNLYGEYTRSSDVTAGAIGARADAFGLRFEQVDGNDVWAVREAASGAIDRARRGEGPTLLEALTYRFVGHSRSDVGQYRPDGELDEWRTRDPLLIARARLEDEHGVGGERLNALEAEVNAELDAVVEAALAAPFPDPAAPAREFKD